MKAVLLETKDAENILHLIYCIWVVYFEGFFDFLVVCNPRKGNIVTSLHKVQNSTNPRKLV